MPNAVRRAPSILFGVATEIARGNEHISNQAMTKPSAHAALGILSAGVTEYAGVKGVCPCKERATAKLSAHASLSILSGVVTEKTPSGGSLLGLSYFGALLSAPSLTGVDGRGSRPAVSGDEISRRGVTGSTFIS
jgi:hypothetical protein